MRSSSKLFTKLDRFYLEIVLAGYCEVKSMILRSSLRGSEKMKIIKKRRQIFCLS